MSYETSDPARFGIDEHNLGIRREFIQLDRSDQNLLRQLIPWIESKSSGMARAFYDWQFSFAPTAQFFSEYAQRKGVSTAELRAGLERAQAHYIEGVFRGAEQGWDLHYFAERLHVGIVHDQINLPFKWYLGSYSLWRRLMLEGLRELFENDKEGSEKIIRVMGAVEKIFNLDIQAIGDAFLMSTFSSMGLDITDITPAPGRDRTEHVEQIKRSLHDLASSVATSVAEVDANIESVAAASEELSASAAEIAQRTNRISQLSSQAASVADDATYSITQLGGSSEEIQKVVASIASVADKTNLLALNATIEAARAGNAGTGFSVVANEVKGLANRTAEATSEIEAKISGIRSEIETAVEALSSIVDRVKSVNELQLTMTTSVDEQVSAISELGRNLADASGATSEIRDQVRVFERADSAWSHH